MRIESRRSLNFWLRALGAGAIVAVAIIWHGEAFQSANELGPELFGNLNAALYLGIVLGAPLLTADCLSKERREGTLSLLFLTPLTPRGIVAAKSFVHALRALTVTAAALPVISLAVLFGGSGWKEAMLALMHNSTALMLALGSGLIASTHVTQARPAGATAVATSVAFTFLGFILHIIIVAGVFSLRVPGYSVNLRDLLRHFMSEAYVTTGADGYWSTLLAAMNPTQFSAWIMASVLHVLVVAGFFAFIVNHAATRLRENVNEPVQKAAPSRWISVLASPFIMRRALNESVSKALSRNPIGWLHLRSTGARLTKWLWALAVCCGGLYMFFSRVGGIEILALALGAGMAFSAAGSFQREREFGVMELILVAPLSIGQIMWGRIRGLWAQFLPAVLAVVIIKVTYALRYYRFDFTILLYALPLFAAVPPIGLRYSLEARNVVIAWMQTVLTALLIPALLGGLTATALGIMSEKFGIPVREFKGLPTMVFLSCLVFNAVQACRRLHGNLQRRDFIIE